MSEQLKPCPFCGESLIKKHAHYKATDNSFVDFDYFEHPYNGCFLEERCCEMYAIQESEISLWDRRACSAKSKPSFFPFSFRRTLEKEFEKWAKENGVLSCLNSFVSWLNCNGLLNVDNAVDFVKASDLLDD